MPVASTHRRWAVIAFFLSSIISLHSTFGQIELLGTYYRPDEAFPEFSEFWNEGEIEPDDEAAGEAADYVRPPGPSRRPAPARFRKPASRNQTNELGGYLHVFVRNAGRTAARIEDVALAGMSLKKALAFSDQRIRKKFASIYFAKLAPEQLAGLIDNGEPVWWKIDPPEIAPGTPAEVIVRLRQKPKVPMVPVGIRSTAGNLEVPLAVTDLAPRLEGVSFAPGLRNVYLYFRHPAGRGTAPARILMDGDDITTGCRIVRDESLQITPVVARLAPPLAGGSFHVFSGLYEDRSSATAGLRAWSDEFIYGVFGGKPGKKNDPRVGRQYVDDLIGHNVNLQMPQIGSGAVQEFFKDPQGQRYMESQGFRLVLSDPGKFGIRDPYALYVHDEPDCGDFKAEGLADDKKIGALAQWVISHADEFRQAAPDVPEMLNINMTYKPHCWHTYGQIPDILAVDPYYQARLRDAWWKHPERIPLYRKATYIYMVSSVARSAAAPNPLHVILYGNRYIDKKDRSKVFRYPTPPEKRIEVYYALAGGAKGLSYWWYTPAVPAYGLGAATLSPPDPQAAALWHEVGLLGAEVRTAGPVLVRSCPIDVPVEAPENLWVRFLACGDDTLVMLVVNDQYSNTDKGTDLKPVRNASVLVRLPAWLDRPQAFEITAAGTRPTAARAGSAGLSIPLGSFDVTRMVVITTDARLRSYLQGYYGARLAGSTAALLKENRR